MANNWSEFLPRNAVYIRPIRCQHMSQKILEQVPPEYVNCMYGVYDQDGKLLSASNDSISLRTRAQSYGAMLYTWH